MPSGGDGSERSAPAVTLRRAVWEGAGCVQKDHTWAEAGHSGVNMGSRCRQECAPAISSWASNRQPRASRMWVQGDVDDGRMAGACCPGSSMWSMECDQSYMGGMPPPPDAPMCPDPAPPPPPPEDDEETEDEAPAGAGPAAVPPHLEIPPNPAAAGNEAQGTPQQGYHPQQGGPGSGPGGVVSPSRLSLSMGPSIVHAASGGGAEGVAPAIAAAVAAPHPPGGSTSPGNGVQPGAGPSQALIPGERAWSTP
jgi:hypothetical protein